MQKLLIYPFKDMLSIGYKSSLYERLTPSPAPGNRIKEAVPELINNYVKSEEEIEAEFCLLAKAENRSQAADSSGRKKSAGETIHSITNASLLSPDFIEENY